MNNKNFAVLEKMLDEIAIARSLMRGSDLTSCALTVVTGGELVKNLDDDFRVAHANVPWKDIAGFRDVAARKYQTLRMEDVYVTASDDFDALATMLGEIIEAEKR